MNLNKTIRHSIPFNHWELHNCLDDLTLEEIANTPIPEGKRAYDGTRAADHTGQGIDGKLRAFVTKENSNQFPYLTKLVKKLQSKDSHQKISEFLKKDLSKSHVRLEIIADKIGFWLKPHKDIPEKLMTMMIWVNPYNEPENLGTDLYNDNFELVKTIKYKHNNGYFFSSGEDTWHGLEKKEIKKERRCIQINYVSFITDWPVE
tara:strand:- start:402 stop:1013 length:612 start_codon:yes stop_codon:yes gene_type:complete